MYKSITILLALVPFGYWMWSVSPFEIPKTWILIAAAVISVIWHLYQELRSGKNLDLKFNNWLLWSVVGLLGWLSITAMIGGDFYGSWIGNYYRHDGLMTVATMAVLGLTLRFDNKLVGLLGWSSTVLAIMTIVSFGKSALLMGNINFLAGYLAVTLPFLKQPIRLGLQLVAIVLLGSWGAILTGIIYILIRYFFKYKKLLILLTVVSIVGVGWLQRVEQIKLNGEGILNAESRERIWSKAILAIKQKPIFGWGWAQYSVAFKEIDYPVHYWDDVYVDRAHSSLLEYGVSGGILGLALFGWIAVVTIKLLWSSKTEQGRALGMVALLYIVHSQTNVTSVAEDWLFFAAVGQAIRTSVG